MVIEPEDDRTLLIPIPFVNFFIEQVQVLSVSSEE